MSNLSPIAFDIETTGLDPGAVITVAGLAAEPQTWLALNTTGRDVDASHLAPALEDDVSSHVEVSVYQTEGDLMEGLAAFSDAHIDGDRHYLTAYNGERWRGGFDLPFLRSACVRRNVSWPFTDIAYADTMTLVDRFDTGDDTDLESVYDRLVGADHCDPFDESASAAAAHENGEWLPLLRHNLADIKRTRELAVLAGRYVAKSDYNMKNLSPPDI